MDNDVTPEQSTVIAEWYRAQQQLATVKTVEMQLRSKLVDMIADKTKQDGTETIHLPAGWQLKIEKSLNYSLDQTNLEEVTANLHENLVAELFKTKIELVPAVYKRLDPSTQRYLDPALTIKPGMPQVKLVPPKAES